MSPLGRRAPTPSLRRIHADEFGRGEAPAGPSNPKQFLGSLRADLCLYQEPPEVFVAAERTAGHSSFGEETQTWMCREIQVRGFPGNLQGSHRHPAGLEQVLLFSKEVEEWTQLIPTPKAGFFFKTPFSNTSNPQRVQAVPELPATIQEGFDYREGQRQKNEKKPKIQTQTKIQTRPNPHPVCIKFSLKTYLSPTVFYRKIAQMHFCQQYPLSCRTVTEVEMITLGLDHFLGKSGYDVLAATS